jgi:hypothetical protein
MTRLFEQVDVLGRVLLDDAPKTPGSEEAIRTAADALLFIHATGQGAALDAYVQSLSAHAPPLAIARFATREEADDWLVAQKQPPASASVLIGEEYFSVLYNPSNGWKRLGRQPRLEHYLQEMADKRLTPSGLSFATKEEAETWMHQQPMPPQQVFVEVAGTPYLAAYHHRIDHRALYPLPPPTPPSQEA